jgi:hypothetical protein
MQRSCRVELEWDAEWFMDGMVWESFDRKISQSADALGAAPSGE